MYLHVLIHYVDNSTKMKLFSHCQFRIDEFLFENFVNKHAAPNLWNLIPEIRIYTYALLFPSY